jgi:hypothetical protein
MSSSNEIDLSQAMNLLKTTQPPISMGDVPKLPEYINKNGQQGFNDIASWKDSVKNRMVVNYCDKYITRNENGNERSVEVEAEREIKEFEPTFQLFGPTEEKELKEINKKKSKSEAEMRRYRTLLKLKLKSAIQNAKLKYAIEMEKKKRVRSFEMIYSSLANDKTYIGLFKDEITKQDPLLLYEKIVYQFSTLYNESHLVELRKQLIEMGFLKGEDLDHFASRMLSYAEMIRDATENYFSVKPAEYISYLKSALKGTGLDAIINLIRRKYVDELKSDDKMIAEKAFSEFINEFRSEFNESDFGKKQEADKAHKSKMETEPVNGVKENTPNNINTSFNLMERGRGRRRGGFQGNRGGSFKKRYNSYSNGQNNSNNNDNHNNTDFPHRGGRNANRGRGKRRLSASPNGSNKRPKSIKYRCFYCRNNSHETSVCNAKDYSPCVFCDGDHTIQNCDKVFCFNCLKEGHKEISCRAHFKRFNWPPEFYKKFSNKNRKKQL